ncbi:histidine phosphatase family protein [Nisaea acidiphila]|uniref:Histidine phosphatase family protein n=1 Tax=Nisaea acidiphila TaxID=1862145 RepID=A0A9J7AV87_9PROT|nr:histidine phosphatase family protein [Nisaea acidiphila]UUX51022.1 histidine phosphatase family protein [Nisaea acidiphila]
MIYLSRHGETVWNRAGRLQGTLDSPLTLKGMRQAERIGKCILKELDGRKVARFVSSPLGRARQTAAIIADVLDLDAHGIDTDERLREASFGSWGGLLMDEVVRAHASCWEARLADRWTVAPPGGESYRDVAQRLQDFIDEHSGLEGGGEVTILVAHGLANRVLRGLILGAPPEEFMSYDEPQDGFYELAEGRERFIEA